MSTVIILGSLLLPALSGIGFLIASSREIRRKRARGKQAVRGLSPLFLILLAVSVLLTFFAAWLPSERITLLAIMGGVSIAFRIDALGRLFATLIALVWLLIGIYSPVYMKHEGHETRYYGFYLLVLSVLNALCFAGNLVTLYLFYELMTILSMPLVLHNGSKEAIMAALKYLFYSMFGAYLGLFGIFVLFHYAHTLNFTPGGAINTVLSSGHETLVYLAVFLSLIGFGAKAGMLPLHAWLPTAHPVAPSPASAALSAIIVKAGVLAVIRLVYYVVGPDYLRGTWVQTAWMSITLATVFMGSLLAFRERQFKKRLAYSTVSQVSYILFGLSVLGQTAVKGALLHVVFHAFIKSALFLSAGIFLMVTQKTAADEYAGIGKKMPKTLWGYTIASLALIGIPPAGGFISKWYLAEGALESSVGIFRYLGPAVLLVSALLTAGYLLPVTMRGFFPGKETPALASVREAPASMLYPLLILAGLALILGIFPNPLLSYVGQIASSVL